MRFKQLAYKYLDDLIGVKKTTVKTYTNCIDTHLIPRIGNHVISDISRSDGMNIISSMQSLNKKPSTINKVMVILKTILTYAIDLDIIETMPITKIKELRVDNKDFPYWNELEAKDFISKVKGHKLYHIIKFGMNTGLRRGEMCGLLWKNVKENNGNLELEFNEQMLPGRERGTVKGFTSRFVPLSPEAESVLKEIGRKNDDDYVFMLPSGKTIEPNWLSNEFRLLQKELGIKNSIKFHGLRHTFASILTSKGVNLQKIQHLLGHRDSKTTERYSHLNQDDLRNTVGIVAF